MDEPSAAGVDRSNWRTPPFSRWAFRHVGEIVPTALIASEGGAVRDLPADPRSLDGFGLTDRDGSSLDLDGFLQTTMTDGLVVLLDGKIVYEFHAPGMTERSPHILMSASKSVTGLVVGILVDDHALDLDAEVTHYVSEVADTAYQGATLRHLIDMRTGVVLNAADQAAYAAATNWEAVIPGAPPADLHAFFSGMTSPAAPHGGVFRYVSANTDLLGWAIERATGRTFAELAGELLWAPMGARDDAAITTDDRGAPRCTGGVIATVGDLARLGELVLQGGRRGGNPIVPQAWIDDLATHGDRRAWADGDFGMAFRAVSTDMSYRGGWYMIHDQPEILFAMGIHGQNLFIDRASGLVIAKLSSWEQPIDHRALVLTHQAVPEIRRLLLARP